MNSLVRVPRLSLVGLALAASFFVECGGDHLVTPVATPTATSAATPVPTAVPTSLPGMSCGVPAVSEDAGRCARVSPGQFVADMNAAAGQVQRDHPEMFDGLRIKDQGGFTVEVLKNLQARGLCAIADGEEIAIKNTNAFSEQYHIVVSTAGGSLRTGFDAYRTTCRPANFPVSPTALPQRGDCRLPSSREYSCSMMSAQFFDLVWAAVDEVKADHPEMFNGDSLKDNDLTSQLYDDVAAILRDQGFCAVFDGEELAVKNVNDFNEQYHLVLWGGKLYRARGSYRGTCKPAAF